MKHILGARLEIEIFDVDLSLYAFNILSLSCLFFHCRYWFLVYVHLSNISVSVDNRLVINLSKNVLIRTTLDHCCGMCVRRSSQPVAAEDSYFSRSADQDHADRRIWTSLFYLIYVIYLKSFTRVNY